MNTRYEYRQITDNHDNPLVSITPLEITASRLAEDGWRIIAVVWANGKRIATLEREVKSPDAQEKTTQGKLFKEPPQRKVK